MPWIAHIESDECVIELKISGVLTQSDLGACLARLRALARKHRTARILADCIRLADGGHSLGDLFFLAETIGSSELAHTFKEAILLPASPAAARMTRFWKTTCINHGLKVSIFKYRKNAMAWLLD